MIREAKTHQLDTVIASSSQEGMVTMNASLANLVKEGQNSPEDALLYSPAPEALAKNL